MKEEDMLAVTGEVAGRINVSEDGTAQASAF